MLDLVRYSDFNRNYLLPSPLTVNFVFPQTQNIFEMSNFGLCHDDIDDIDKVAI